MIEAIREIGRIKSGEGGYSKKSGILESLLEDTPKPKKENNSLHIVILNYDTIGRKIEIDFEDIKENTSQKYLWLGTLPSNNPQFYLTVANLDYLLSQTIPNLAKKASTGSKLSKMLSRVLNSMFYDLEMQGRYRFVLDLERCGFVGKGYVEKGYMKELKEKVLQKKRKGMKEKDIFREIIIGVRAKMDEFVSHETPLKKKDIGLYTLKINDKLMARNEGYREIIIKEKIDSLFGQQKKFCSSCGEYELILDKPKFSRARSALGYYITDKVGFSSNLSGDFTKNFILCKDCYKSLLSGEVFVRNRLSSNIGGLSLYIIPKFLFPIKISPKKLDKLAEYAKISFNFVKSFSKTGLKEFEKKLRKYVDSEDEKNSFILNLLFWKRGTGVQFKILKLIKEAVVPVYQTK